MIPECPTVQHVPLCNGKNVPNNLISVLSHGLKVQIFSPPFKYALVVSLTVTPYSIRAYQQPRIKIYKINRVQNLNSILKWKEYGLHMKVSGLYPKWIQKMILLLWELLITILWRLFWMKNSYSDLKHMVI